MEFHFNLNVYFLSFWAFQYCCVIVVHVGVGATCKKVILSSPPKKKIKSLDKPLSGYRVRDM